MWNPISYLKSSISTEGKKTLSFLQTATPHLFPHSPVNSVIYFFSYSTYFSPRICSSLNSNMISIPKSPRHAFSIPTTLIWLQTYFVCGVRYIYIHIYILCLYKNVERHSRLVWYVYLKYIFTYSYSIGERVWWSDDPPFFIQLRSMRFGKNFLICIRRKEWYSIQKREKKVRVE